MVQCTVLLHGVNGGSAPPSQNASTMSWSEMVWLREGGGWGGNCVGAPAQSPLPPLRVVEFGSLVVPLTHGTLEEITWGTLSGVVRVKVPDSNAHVPPP